MIRFFLHVALFRMLPFSAWRRTGGLYVISIIAQRGCRVNAWLSNAAGFLPESSLLRYFNQNYSNAAIVAASEASLIPSVVQAGFFFRSVRWRDTRRD
jgi:hypothetical protein